VERLQGLTELPLYRTDQHGTIEFVSDGRALWIYAGN